MCQSIGAVPVGASPIGLISGAEHALKWEALKDLKDTGDLAEVIPAPVLNLAIFFGAIVAWVTDHLLEGDEHTNVHCRHSPRRRRCRGDIIAELDRTSGYIVWQCPLCGDHGMIHGWEDTLWNRHGGVRSQPTAPPSTARH